MKNKGFTLLEVMIATAALGLSLYILSGIQFKSRVKVIEKAEEVERVFFVKKFLYNLFLSPSQKNKPETITLEKPDIQITTNKQGIDTKKSSLKPFAKEVDIITSEGVWTREPDKRSLKMVSFALKPKQDEQK